MDSQTPVATFVVAKPAVVVAPPGSSRKGAAHAAEQWVRHREANTLPAKDMAALRSVSYRTGADNAASAEVPKLNLLKEARSQPKEVDTAVEPQASFQMAVADAAEAGRTAEVGIAAPEAVRPAEDGIAAAAAAGGTAAAAVADGTAVAAADGSVAARPGSFPRAVAAAAAGALAWVVRSSAAPGDGSMADQAWVHRDGRRAMQRAVQASQIVLLSWLPESQGLAWAMIGPRSRETRRSRSVPEDNRHADCWYSPSWRAHRLEPVGRSGRHLGRKPNQRADRLTVQDGWCERLSAVPLGPDLAMPAGCGR